MQTVIYDANALLPFRFWDHTRFGLQTTVQPHQKNICEKVGDLGLWPLETIPRFLRDCLYDPRVITIGLTAIASVANSLLFYNEITMAKIDVVVQLIREIPFWAVKFGAYVCTSETILAAGARAFGRFTNHELMNKFYGSSNLAARNKIN